MALEIAVDFPDMPKGKEFDVGGILVKNKGSVKLSKEQEEALVARHGKPVKEALKSENVKVTGTTEVGGGESN